MRISIPQFTFALLTLLLCVNVCGGSLLGKHAMAVKEATMDSTKALDFISQINGEAYRIKIFVPSGKPPEKGFPTLYVLDGDLLFPTYADAMRNESRAGDLMPAVIVGIEGGTGPKGADRTYDFTNQDETTYEKRIVVDLGPNPRYGGYEKFFKVIEDEIKPQVAKLAPVNPAQSSLLGWSLGGFFVVHTLLTHPDAFETYVALSPALWRSGKAVFAEIPEFEQRVRTEQLRPNLFLAVGALEEQLSSGMKKWPVNQVKFAQEVKYAHMVGNATSFAGQVSPYFKESELRFSYHIFDGDTHNTVPWTAVNPALRFAFPVN